MAEATRWTSSAVYTWKPILTFTRRRLALLDWFEENTRPVAFTDDPDHAGIAIGSEEQRLRFDRQTLVMAADGPGAQVSPLGDALAGAWEALDPANVTFRLYSAAWSIPIEDEYERARSRFARRVTGLSPESSGGLPVAFDAAAIVDIAGSQGVYKVEFGVVTAEELGERLEESGHGLTQASPFSRAEMEQVDREQLAPVSVFFEVQARSDTKCPKSQDVVAQYESVEQEVGRLVTAIGGSL